MRQVAGLFLRASHSLLALFEKGIEVIHERLNFRWIAAIDLVLSALPHFRESRSQLIEFRQPFLDLQKPAENECSREAPEQEHMPVHELRGMPVQMERKQVRAREQSG